MAPIAKKIKQNGKLLMDQMVESLWRSKDYLATAEETISLVEKAVEMPGTTSRGFASQTTRVGQMKLDAPPQYLGKRKLGVQVWLTQMECDMRLMRYYAPANWLDFVAMHVEGATCC